MLETPNSGLRVSWEDEGEVRVSVKLLLLALFNVSSLQRKHPHHLFYLASYVAMHSALSIHCHAPILKVKSAHFFSHVFHSCHLYNALIKAKQPRQN